MARLAQLMCTCLWEWLSGRGLERFALFRQDDCWRLEGTILALHNGAAAEVRYQIDCSGQWHTRTAAIQLLMDDTVRELAVTIEDDRWSSRDGEIIDVRGCSDVDLGWTPSTNMVLIRRLNLAVGEDSGIINAAWVRFPELTIEVLPQRYERLAPDLYRYSSQNGTFVAQIHVDRQGVPVEYEGFWRRLR